MIENIFTREVTIRLNEVSDIYEFVKIAEQQPFAIDVRSLDRHYCLDAKSVMGLLSLDLSQPILITTNEDSFKSNDFFKAIYKFSLPQAK